MILLMLGNTAYHYFYLRLATPHMSAAHLFLSAIRLHVEVEHTCKQLRYKRVESLNRGLPEIYSSSVVVQRSIYFCIFNVVVSKKYEILLIYTF